MPAWFLVHPRGLVLRRDGDALALPTIPPRISIARRLIDAWVAEVGK